MTDSPYFPARRFQANQVSDVNPSYYLSQPNNSDVLANYNQWSNNLSSMHFADYIRTNPDLANAWNNSAWTGGDSSKRLSRWDRGSWHWDHYGKNEPGRTRPLVVGKREPWMGGNTRTIWTGSGYEDSSKNDFAAWHFDTSGRNEGRYGTFQAFYDSPGETQKRLDAIAAQADQLAQEQNDTLVQIAQEQNDLKTQIAADEVAVMQSAAEGAEYGRLASRRGGGSQTLGASGAATFKGKGLKSSENKRGRGRGTGQLRRPYGASNLSIAAGTGAGQRQGTGLNRAGLG